MREISMEQQIRNLKRLSYVAFFLFGAMISTYVVMVVGLVVDASVLVDASSFSRSLLMFTMLPFVIFASLQIMRPLERPKFYSSLLDEEQ